MAIIKNCRGNFLRFFEILPRALLRATCFGFIVLTYFTSAIVLNFIQFLILRFFLIGKTKRRAIVRKICQFWWNLTDFSAFYFLGLNLKFYGEPIEKAENAILICNHCVGIDFISAHGMFAALKIKTCNVIGLLKWSLMFLPGVGSMNYAQGGLFLKRKWDEDKSYIKAHLSSELKNRTEPLMIALFPEGSRASPKKIASSQKFARKNGLPILKNVLIPRTKGFNLILNCTQNFIKFVYDVTLMYYPYPIPFTQLIFFPASNSPRDVHVLIKKYEIADVPKKEEELRKWTMDRFLEKEKQIEYFKRNRKFLDGNSFSEHQKSKLTSFVVLSFLSIVSLRMTGLISENFVKFWLLMVFMTIAESAQNFLTNVK